MDTENLVSLITQAVISQLRKIELRDSPPDNAPKLLVAFSGGSLGFKQSMLEMESLSRDFRLQVMLSKSAAQIYQGHERLSKLSSFPVVLDDESVRLDQLLEEAKGLVIPVLTFNSLAKVAAGICDTLFLNVIIHSLIQGIPVLAARNAADLEDQERKKVSGDKCSPGLKILAKENLKKLEKLGVRVTDAASLAAETRSILAQRGRGAFGKLPGAKKIITKLDISAEVFNTKRLAVPSGAILTPLVQDLIRDEEIKLIEN